MRSKSILVVAIVVLLGSSWLSKPAVADLAWIIQTVDSAAYVDTKTSIALDAAGRPRISYFDYTNQDLKYAVFDGLAWNVETVDSTGYVGEYPSLALDASGNPHISYRGDSGGLKYATIPEPATLLLLGLGAVMLRKNKCKKQVDFGAQNE